jgi:transposase
VTQQHLFEPIPCDKFGLLTREELEIFANEEQRIRIALQRENEELKKERDRTCQQSFFINEQYVLIKNKYFGKSSEKSPKSMPDDDCQDTSKVKKIKVQLPSLRYPNAPLIEKDIELEELPMCKCCGHKMEDSGMTEDSEYLTTIPRQFLVVRQKRHKYRCGKCHGDIQTTPALPKIKMGSSYSDEMLIDVAMSKYCDLIPIERYTAMAERDGIKDLPAHSLIESTHNLANFVRGAYDKLNIEATSSKVLRADETPHRMLEGDKKSNWYLWGFSTERTSYFEVHDTRSGDVASKFLRNSVCEYLVSDVYSGYGKAVRGTNVYRRQENKKEIQNVYCNAHARRKFKEAEDNFDNESQFFIDQYKAIYCLESEAKEKPPNEKTQYREKMILHFEDMKAKAMLWTNSFPSKSSIGRAIQYFLKNYYELTLFVKNIDLPIDNNSQERLMRNPVIGRKTWYGTHSKRGAETNAVLFSLVESCKLNKINPRKYFKDLVESLHYGNPAFTPSEYEKLSNNVAGG